MSLKGGGRRYRSCLTQTMSDEQIARMTISELTDLIKRLLDEIEIRAMELS